MTTPMTEKAVSRREFVKKAVYVAPIVLTLKAAPAFARAGSGAPPFTPPGPPPVIPPGSV
jgi:hypothetical protein